MTWGSLEGRACVLLRTVNVKYFSRLSSIGGTSRQEGSATLDFPIDHLYHTSLHSTFNSDDNFPRCCFSIVSQNTFLFSDTIKRNISYSRPDARDEEIEEAARTSGTYVFISNLERGFETKVGERGVRLSGGEKQKISIARAILKESDVIILDEAMTHLDREAKKITPELIIKRFKDKAIIIISHKIRKTFGVDKLFFFEKGGILETV